MEIFWESLFVFLGHFDIVIVVLILVLAIAIAIRRRQDVHNEIHREDHWQCIRDCGKDTGATSRTQFVMTDRNDVWACAYAARAHPRPLSPPRPPLPVAFLAALMLAVPWPKPLPPRTLAGVQVQV